MHAYCVRYRNAALYAQLGTNTVGRSNGPQGCGTSYSVRAVHSILQDSASSIFAVKKSVPTKFWSPSTKLHDAPPSRIL